MNSRRLSWLLFSTAGVVGCDALLGIPSEVGRADAAAQPAADGGDFESGAPPLGEAGAADAEAGAAPPPCDLTKDFDAPVPILATAEQEGGARLSEDELTIYLDGVRAARDPSFDIFFAKRDRIGDAFGELMPIPGALVNTGVDEYAPNVTDDGKTLFFERQEMGNSDFYRATRASKDDPFDAPSPVPNLATPNYEGNIFVRGDGSEIWFVRSAPSVDIFVATLVAGAGYVVREPANVNSASDDFSPVISKNRLLLFFSSRRPVGASPARDTNIWVATRASPADEFGTPALVRNVNSSSNEYPGWISADGCRLYMVSSRPPPPGSPGGLQDVYLATRPR